jgi:DNA-binding MarR family transcriptional regulator
MHEATGLPLAWFEVLVQLDKAPQRRLRMGDLGRAVLLSKSGVTKVISRMETGGLVRRHTPPENLRTTYAVLTDAGRRALKNAVPIHHRGIEEHFARHVSARDAATISRVARTVTQAQLAQTTREDAVAAQAP